MGEARVFSDIEIGETCASRAVEVTEDDIRSYASAFDPQPMHLDHDAAEASFFGRLVGSGWHALSLTMRLMVETRPFGATPLIGVRVTDISIRRPLLPGASLSARAEVTGKRISAGGEHGYVMMTVETLDGEDVLITQKWTVLVPLRV
jgi:acyl dehydratase